MEGTNPALENAHKIAQKKGFKGDINSFKTLISTNEGALGDVYNSVRSQGYNKDINSFKALVGIEAPKKKKASTSTSDSQKSVSEPQNGSSDIVAKNNETARSIPKGTKFRLATEEEAQAAADRDILAKRKSGKEGETVITQFTEQEKKNIGYKPKKISKEKIEDLYSLDKDGLIKKAPENEFSKFADFNTSPENRAILKSALQKHDQETTVDETFIKDAVAEADEIAGGNNTWENVKSGAKGMFNTWLLQNPGVSGIAEKMGVNPYQNTDPLAEEKTKARKKLIDSGVEPKKINDADVLNEAKKIYAENKIKDKKLSLSNDFYENLDDKEKEALELKFTYDKSKLTDEDNRLIQNLKLTKARIKDLTFDAEPILAKIKNKEQISPEEFKIVENLDKQINIHNDIYDDYQSNSKGLLSAAEELDLVKREYGEVQNFIADVGTAGLRIGLGALQTAKTALIDYNPAFMAFNELSKLNNGTEEAGGIIDEISSNIDLGLGKAQSELEKWNQNTFRKNTENFNNVNDGINFVTDLIGNQAPNIALMIATGGGSSLATRVGVSGNKLALGSIGAYSYGNKKNEMIGSNNSEDPNNRTYYSDTQIELASILYGGSEMFETATLGSLGKTKRFIGASLAEAPTRELFRKSIKDNIISGLKSNSKDVLEENIEEQVTNLIQNYTERNVLGRNEVGLFDNAGEVLKSSTAMALLLKAPQFAGAVAKKFQPKQYNDVLDNNAKEILSLFNELKKEGLSKQTQDVIGAQISKLSKESDAIVKKTFERIGKLPTEQIDKVVELEKSTAELRAKAVAIRNDEALSKETKENLIKNLSSEYKTQEDLRTKIVSEKATILDILPENEVTDLKKKAVETLLVENAGKNEANFTEEVINQKAIELHNQSNNNQITEPTETNTSEQVAEEISTNNQITPTENVSPLEEVVYPEVSDVENEKTTDQVYADNAKKSFIEGKINAFTLDENGLYLNTNGVRVVNGFKDNGNMDVFEASKVELTKDEKREFRQIEADREFGDKDTVERKRDLAKRIFKRSLDEAAPSQDIADDGNIRSSDAVVDQDGSANKGDNQDSLQQPTESQGDNRQTKVTTKTIVSKTAKGADSEFDVDTDDNNNIVEVRSKKDGRIIPKFVERKTKQIDKVNGGFKTILAKNANYAKIEADYYGTKTDNQIKVENEKQFNDTVQNFDASNEYEAALVSLATGSKVSKESLQNETGNSDNKWATNQFSTEQLPNIETLAEQIVENSPLELDVQEVRNALIDIITSNQAIEDVKNEVVSKYDEKNKSFQEEELNAYLGTLNEEELAKYEANRVDEEFISELTDNEVIEYFQQKLEEYEQGQRATTEEGESAKTPIESRQATANSNENQQRKEEQPAAEVDLSFFENITNQDNIQEGLDWLDNLMLDPNDLKVTLPFLPQTWNAFIEAIKIAYKAGNTMSKAIQEGIKALEALGTSKSEIDAIVDAFTRKAKQDVDDNGGTFKRKAGKKSLLSRLKKGDNDQSVIDALEKSPLDYTVRNQEEAYNKAVEFVDNNGIIESYNAIKNNLIENMDIKALIYNEILQRMPAEIDAELEGINDIAEYSKAQEELYKEFARISSEFSDFATNLGQGISVLNFIYNQNSNLQYELSKQVEKHKASNNGEISPEVLAKFEEADKKIKELTKKIAEAEKKLIDAEEQLAVNNIVEQLARAKNPKATNKVLPSDKAKALADKLRNLKIGNRPGAFKSSVGADIVWDSAVEITAKAIETTGDITQAVQKGLKAIRESDWYKNLTKNEKAEAEFGFTEFFIDNVEIEKEQEFARYDKNGKLIVPPSLIKKYVAEGFNKIETLSERIIDDLENSGFNPTEREVRDAITGYGKTAGKTRPEIDVEIAKLKSLGKLISKLEDLQNGITKTKSEVKKRNLTEQEKEIKAQIKQLENDLGLNEERRTKAAKTRLKNKIEELKERIAKKDYSKKEVKPIQEDAELRSLRAEKLAQQEIFDKEAYISEINNRNRLEKFRDTLLGVWNIPRILMATGEMSWVLIQGGVQTTSNLITNPKRVIKAIGDMFKAMANTDYANKWENELKSSEFYLVANSSRLALTESDHKLEAREEQFLGDFINVIWDLPGLGLKAMTKNKDYITTKGLVKRLFGKQLNESDYKNLNEQWRNANPMRVLERGNTMYMNQMRINRFMDGMQMLQLQGKNHIDNIDEYKKVAAAVNSLTGRANVDKYGLDSKTAAAIFFSFRNWVAKINMMNPYYYASLGNYSSPEQIFTKKPTVAQKIMVTDMVKYITFTGSMLLLLKAAMGDDEEGNPNATIETDPRSSDFMKLKTGNLRLDPWGGLQSSVTFFTRILLDETKSTKTGEIVKGGTKFGSRTRDQLTIDYVSGKFNPSTSMAWNFFKSSEKEVDGEIKRLDKFGNEVNPFKDAENFTPMYWGAIEDIKKEQPGLWGDFFMVSGALGINSQVYGNRKEDKK